MSGIRVNVDNFVRAESDRMFAALLGDSGAVNRWVHYRQVAPVDHQNIIRQNRDTLYSAAIVDVSGGVRIEVPDAGDRYLSVMVIDQDHHVDRIIHDAGPHQLGPDEVPTRFALLGARILVDPTDTDDVRRVNALQDALSIDAASDGHFELPDYDAASLDATRRALLDLARGLTGFDRAFGRRGEVDPVRHLIGAAAGWGGLPEYEAFYANIEPGLPVGDYAIDVTDVPVDGFWSVSVYDASGYFVPNERGVYNVNSLTAQRSEDGSVTVNFGAGDPGDERPNLIPVPDGWNYMVRLYRPHPEVLDGSWTFPPVHPV